MGKTFENLIWDDLCDLMCGTPEDEPKPIREKDYRREGKRCLEPTYYQLGTEVNKAKYPWKSCVYLDKHGNCELTCCVKGRGTE